MLHASAANRVRNLLFQFVRRAFSLAKRMPAFAAESPRERAIAARTVKPLPNCWLAKGTSKVAGKKRRGDDDCAT
jgi:hypothetical protein